MGMDGPIDKFKIRYHKKRLRRSFHHSNKRVYPHLLVETQLADPGFAVSYNIIRKDWDLLGGQKIVASLIAGGRGLHWRRQGLYILDLLSS